MNLGLLTGAPGTAMLAPPLLLSGSSPPPPPSPDAQLHALRRTISTLIERYASLARTQLRGGLDVRLPEGDAVLDALALQGAREADGLRAQLAELREANRQGARRVEQERQRCAASSAVTSARTPAGSAKKRDAPPASTRRRSENKRPARERPAVPPAFDIFDDFNGGDFRFS